MKKENQKIVKHLESIGFKIGVRMKADKGTVKVLSDYKVTKDGVICSVEYTSGMYKGERTDNFHLNEFLTIKG